MYGVLSEPIGEKDQLGHPGRNPFSTEALLLGVFPWAVLWFIGYMLDRRMPWQIIRAGE
jgi:hypothetical protein